LHEFIHQKMSVQRIVALLGRRDQPTDGVEDYCAFLGRALRSYGHEFELVRVPWSERGWSAALAELEAQSAGWRKQWVLLQYTTFGWSRRGFPLQVPRILTALQKNNVRCAVVFHDFAPASGRRAIDRLRARVQSNVLKQLCSRAEASIFTVAIDHIGWTPPGSGRRAFIPVGANLPDLAAVCEEPAAPKSSRTVAIFSVTGGSSTQAEIADIGAAVKHAAGLVGPLRLLVVGRGSREAEPALRMEFSGSNVDVAVMGVLPADEMKRLLSGADAQLFVRGQISSRRGSAIAGIACGLPLICYSGPETAWPITEAGLMSVPLGDRQGLAAALARVLGDDELRASLIERSRHAQASYFSWQSIAKSYLQVLQLNAGSQAES
jgi:glycosyltransferase involved in cell wall biosynthesis